MRIQEMIDYPIINDNINLEECTENYKIEAWFSVDIPGPAKYNYIPKFVDMKNGIHMLIFTSHQDRENAYGGVHPRTTKNALFMKKKGEKHEH